MFGEASSSQTSVSEPRANLKKVEKLRFVEKDTLCYLRHKATKKYVSVGQLSFSEENSTVPTFEVALRDSLSSKYVLKISRVSASDMADSNCLLSCLHHIEGFLLKLKRLTFIKMYPNLEKPIEILRLLLSLNDNFA